MAKEPLPDAPHWLVAPRDDDTSHVHISLDAKHATPEVVERVEALLKVLHKDDDGALAEVHCTPRDNCAPEHDEPCARKYSCRICGAD